MLLPRYALFAVLAAIRLAGAADDAWKDAFKQSLKNQIESQAQASMEQVVPSIVSQSAANVINEQFAPFTQNQPAASPAPAPVATPAPRPVTAQQANPVANPAPAATQNPVLGGNAGGGGDTAPIQQEATAPVADQPAPTTQQAVTPVSSNVPVDLVVIDGATFNAADVQVSTLRDGTIVTIAGGKTITGSIKTLTDNSSKSNSTNAVSIGETGSNSTVSSGNGLSKTATIGMGVGLGVFGVSLVSAILGYRWWSKRRRQHSRAPSIVISGPLEAKQSPDVNTSRPGTPSPHYPEMDGRGKSLAAGLDHASTTASRRSPVSPWTPATSAMGTSSSSPAQQPNIYEMLGSEPVEMAAAPTGVEMAAPESAQELNSAIEEIDADGLRQKTRPFSFVETPVDAFICEKRPIQSGMVDDNLVDNRV